MASPDLHFISTPTRDLSPASHCAPAASRPQGLVDDGITGACIRPQSGPATENVFATETGMRGVSTPKAPKMKCVVDGDPPCERCRRSGRRCIPNKSQRRPYRNNTVQKFPDARSTRQQEPHVEDALVMTPDSGRTTLQTAGPVVSPLTSQCQDSGSVGQATHSLPYPRQNLRDQTTSLPSIYSAAPVDTVNVRDHPSISTTATPLDSYIPTNGTTPRAWHRPITGYQANQSTSGVGPNNYLTLGPPVSDRELERFMHYFSEKMITFVPAARRKVVEEMVNDIPNDRTAVTMIAYAAARFVPGAGPTGDQLYLDVVKFLNTAVVEGWTSSLRTLYGLMVLYNYTDIPSSASRRIKPKGGINFWFLKSLTESSAQALQCHRAFTTLNLSIKSNTPGVTECAAFELYLCWLWLFTMSHYVSLATATPPTIHADTAIKAGPALLRQLDPTATTSSLANQVEICLVWEHMRHAKAGMAEWWCPPVEPNGDFDYREATSKALEELQRIEDRLTTQVDAVARMHGQTRPCQCRPEHALRGRDLFHVRFARFCIYSYSVRDSSSPSLVAVHGKTPHPLMACFDAALDMVQWKLDVCFTERIAVIHASDSSAIMIALCCLFVLQCAEVASKLRQGMPYLRDLLGRVHEVGQIISDLSVHYRRNRPDYGQHIQATASTLLARLEEQACGDNISTTDGLEQPVDTLFDASMCDLDELGLYDFFNSYDFDDMYPLDKLWTLGKE